MDSPVKQTIEVISINFNVNKILINMNLGLLDPMHVVPHQTTKGNNSASRIICENTDEYTVL